MELPREIQDYIDIVENEVFRTCEEQKELIAHIKACFETEMIYVDTDQLDKYMDVCEQYLPFELFPWQPFLIALHDCTYWEETGQPRWPDLFVMIGRGGGKDGTIATEALLLTSPYNGIREYDVDICANNEEQAIRPVQDLTGFFENPQVRKKIQ